MKVSSYITNRYLGAEAYEVPQWPSLPGAATLANGKASYDIGLEQAALADELGFDWVSCSEHHYSALIQTPSVGVYGAALCSVVKRAKIALLGPLVPLNNPIRLAEEVAQLNQISGGRVVMLPLRGTPNEFLSYGVDPSETRAMTEEATLLMVRALREKQPFGWQGRYFKYRTVAVFPPAIGADIPFYYSGNSRESASFAAANGFGFAASFFPPHFIAKLIAFYREECESYGWSPSPDNFLYRCFAGVAESEAEAETLRTKYFQGPSMLSLAKGRGGAFGVLKQAEEGFGLGELRFCGSPDQVVQQIHDFYDLTGMGVIDMGFSGSGLTHEETCRSMTLFAEEVLPRVRHLGASETAAKRPAAPVRAAVHAAPNAQRVGAPELVS